MNADQFAIERVCNSKVCDLKSTVYSSQRHRAELLYVYLNGSTGDDFIPLPLDRCPPAVGSEILSKRR